MHRLDIGDQVRITGEGSAHEGLTGYLSCVDSGTLHYVATAYGDELYGPYARNELSAIMTCEWFLKCTREATGTVAHPILGDVPTCDPCTKFANGE